MRGYYSIHDLSGDRLGFTPHSKSRKELLVKENIPLQVLSIPLRVEKKSSARAWAMTIGFIPGVAFGFYTLIVKLSTSLFGSTERSAMGFSFFLT